VDVGGVRGSSGRDNGPFLPHALNVSAMHTPTATPNRRDKTKPVREEKRNWTHIASAYLGAQRSATALFAHKHHVITD
jgi:hypothetical protein